MTDDKDAAPLTVEDLIEAHKMVSEWGITPEEYREFVVVTSKEYDEKIRKHLGIEDHIGICGECGETKEILYYNWPDPYIEEVHPEKLTDSDYKDWCSDCYKESCMDI